ncbi:hypothetical protein EV421DRAFT_1792850 [Armillaria borealis]|uniref:Uncharacterized protein n=1 Tax=Armillaria borealis TaxID=47425 RepID=A0AA39JNU3_9AGAR|nr:hypothetical protein EV421DRAFT_1792850 [Armillaria borealis]
MQYRANDQRSSICSDISWCQTWFSFVRVHGQASGLETIFHLCIGRTSPYKGMALLLLLSPISAKPFVAVISLTMALFRKKPAHQDLGALNKRLCCAILCGFLIFFWA